MKEPTLIRKAWACFKALRWGQLSLLWLAYLLFNALDFGQLIQGNVFQSIPGRVFYYALIYFLVREQLEASFLLGRLGSYRAYLGWAWRRVCLDFCPRLLVLLTGFVLLSYPLGREIIWPLVPFFYLALLMTSLWMALLIQLFALLPRPLPGHLGLWLAILITARLPLGWANLFGLFSEPRRLDLASLLYLCQALVWALFLLALVYLLLRLCLVQGRLRQRFLRQKSPWQARSLLFFALAVLLYAALLSVFQPYLTDTAGHLGDRWEAASLSRLLLWDTARFPDYSIVPTNPLIWASSFLALGLPFFLRLRSLYAARGFYPLLLARAGSYRQFLLFQLRQQARSCLRCLGAALGSYSLALLLLLALTASAGPANFFTLAHLCGLLLLALRLYLLLLALGLIQELLLLFGQLIPALMLSPLVLTCLMALDALFPGQHFVSYIGSGAGTLASWLLPLGALATAVLALLVLAWKRPRDLD